MTVATGRWPARALIKSVSTLNVATPYTIRIGEHGRQIR